MHQMIHSNSAPSEASTYAQSSVTPSDSASTAESKYDDEIMRVINKIGYTIGTKIANTLQGSVWRISKTSQNSGKLHTAVIKATNQRLYRHRRALINGQLYRVKEDILTEQKILKYLTQSKTCPNSIVKYKWFFKTDTDYYLLMEDAGDALFDFVVKGHHLIKNKNIGRLEWNRAVKVIFKQMVNCIAFLHSHNICHFDISLENFLINDVHIEIDEDDTDQDKKWKLRFITDDINIKLCDFGLAHQFNNSYFVSDKFCGKKRYQSPEVVREQEQFDAVKNDIWSLGICLYMMTFCSIPWDVANNTDQSFVYYIKHSMDDLLKYWDILSCIDEHTLCLLKAIFQYESNRICLKKIKEYVDEFF